jgi:hypothetical protein
MCVVRPSVFSRKIACSQKIEKPFAVCLTQEFVFIFGGPTISRACKKSAIIAIQRRLGPSTKSTANEGVVIKLNTFIRKAFRVRRSRVQSVLSVRL